MVFFFVFFLNMYDCVIFVLKNEALIKNISQCFAAWLISSLLVAGRW